MSAVSDAGALPKHAGDDMTSLYFQSLAGAWELERSFSDDSHFAGQAVFVELGNDGFLLSESGTFQRPDGSIFSAGRDWQWCLVERGLLDIHYAKASGGGLYHRLALRREDTVLVGEAEHVCGKDAYSGHYRFSQNQIDVHQKVFGPKKDYELTSAYVRLRSHRHAD